MNRVCILDYGSGNTKSVFNLLVSLTKNVIISNDVEDINNATHIILPGVGSFGASMSKINNTIPMGILKTTIFESKIPFLGICVGMQVMADTGYEFDEFVGLGWIHGSISLLKSKDLALPHVGWNNISKKRDSRILHGIEDGTDFYFVHSYAFVPENDECVTATTSYGENFCAIIENQNLFGVQFHPEKSQIAGKKLIQNFLDI